MSLLSKVAALEQRVIGYRRTLHQNPELGFEEFETTRLIEQVLTEQGIEHRSNGDKTGVIGTIYGKNPGPVIALRADIDALRQTEAAGLPFASQVSGVCHSCGHDLHAAVLLGVACLLQAYQEQLCGTIRLLFQPAEETLGGAQSMIANGALADPTPHYLLATHCWPELPAGTIGVRRGAMFAAADHFTIRVKGKSGHAAHPHRCVDPIVIAAHIITQLQTIVSRQVAPIDAAVLSIGHLTAGTVSNIIPEQAVMEGTVRTLDPKTREAVQQSMISIAQNTARGMGAEAEVSFDAGVPSMWCEDALVEAISTATTTLLGADKLHTLTIPSMGAEDMAFYLEQIPGALFRIGTGDETPNSRGALHNSATTFNEKAIPTGIVAMVGTVFVLTGSDLSLLL